MTAIQHIKMWAGGLSFILFWCVVWVLVGWLAISTAYRILSWVGAGL